MAAALTFFPCLTKGHVGHRLLHLFIVRRFILGLEGTLALKNISLTFGGLLWAIRGGSGYTSDRWGLVTIVLQCLCTIPDIDGSLGS